MENVLATVLSHTFPPRVSDSTSSDLDITVKAVIAGNIGFISGYFLVQISIAINVNCNLNATHSL